MIVFQAHAASGPKYLFCSSTEVPRHNRYVCPCGPTFNRIHNCNNFLTILQIGNPQQPNQSATADSHAATAISVVPVQKLRPH